MLTAKDMNRKITQGFTLIEMIVSLVLLSFITIIGYQGLMFGVNQWRIGHDKMLFQYDYHQAVSWIRNKTAVSEKVKKPGGNDFSYFFTGEKHSVEFVTRYSRARKGGLYVSKIVYDAEYKSIDVIYYLHHPDMKNAIENNLSEKTTLLSNVSAIEFSYYGKKGGAKAKWHTHWKDDNSLPQLLKLDIESGSGSHYQSTIYMATSNNV